MHAHLVLFAGVACRVARGRPARSLLGSTLAALLVPVLLLEVVVRAQLPSKVLVQRLGPKPEPASSDEEGNVRCRYGPAAHQR